MLVPSGLRLEVADGTKRQRAVLTDTNIDVHAARRYASGLAHAADSVTGDADADSGRHWHAPHPDADSGAGIDPNHGNADTRAGDPHADRSGSDGDARHARADEYAFRGNADANSSLTGISAREGTGV